LKFSFKNCFYNANINYEINSNRSQRYGTSFFVGLDTSKTSDDEEKHSHSKSESLNERKEDSLLNSDKEFSSLKPHQRYSQFSPNIDDIANSVKRDLIRNYKESLNKQLDSFELLSNDFHNSIPREVEFDFKTFRYLTLFSISKIDFLFIILFIKRICPQKTDTNEEYWKETRDNSFKWNTDYLNKKDCLRHDELTTTCNSFLKGSPDFASSHLKYDENRLSSKRGFFEQKEAFNKYDFVHEPKAKEETVSSFAHKNDEDLERRLKMFNLNEQEQIRNDQKGKYDLSSKKDPFDNSYDFEKQFNSNRFNDENKLKTSLSSKSQVKSSYLPLKDVPVHDLVKKLRNEFELEGDIDRLSSKINVFWDK